MEMITMANGGHVSYSSIKPCLLHGFPPTPTNPISRIALKKKRNRNRICSGGVESGNGSVVVIEKQFEFEPSFDEYLKAMESVKSGRDNRPTTLKDVGGEAEVEEGVAKASNWGRNDRAVRGKSVSTRGSVHRKVEFKENEEDEVGGSVDKMSPRWTNGVTRDKMHRGSYRKTNASSGVELSERGSDEKRKYTNALTSSATRVGDTERLGNVSRWMPERKHSYDTRATNGSSLDRTLNDWERTSKGGDEMERGERETAIWKKKSATRRSEVDRQIHDYGYKERRSDYGTEKNVMSNWNQPKSENPGYQGSDARLEVDRGYQRNEDTRRSTYGTEKNVMSNWNEPKSENPGYQGSDARLEVDRGYRRNEDTRRSTYGTEKNVMSNWSEPKSENPGYQGSRARLEVDRGYRRNEDTRRSTYGTEKNVISNWNEPKSENSGYQGSGARLEVDRGYRRNEDTRLIKSAKFGKGANFLEEEDDEGDMEMERAAFKSFEVFNDLRGQPRVLKMEMEERIQNLAKWLNGTDIDLPEWLFSKMIHSARIRFSDHSILRVIQILGTLGNWRRALQVIEWLESRERFKSYKSRFIYTTALDVLGKAKRPVEALNVFHAMRKGMSSYPDLAAYHCIAVTLGQAGYVKELFDVIDCMKSPPPTKFNTGYIEKWDPRLEPDIIIYNAVLNACARRKQWEGAFWVLQQLKEQGLQPSSTTYGLVMEVMFACKKYNLVYEFFRKVQKSTIPNTLNYKVLVNTLWKEGKTDDAVFAVKDMERRGIVGSASLYYDLARCLCSAGRCQEALMQMDNICKVARKPLVVTYTGLIQACLDSGNVQDGTYIFKQMQAFCSPNLVTYNIMLKAYLDHRMFEDAKDLFQKMLDESSHINRRSDYKNIATPDSYTFNTMLDACTAEQKWDDFRYIFQEMFHRGYNFNTRRHLRMILDACRAGKVELLEMTWKHLVRANRVPPPPLIKEMFCMKLEKNDYTAAITSITSHPTSDQQLHAFSKKGWLDLLEANRYRLQKDTIISLTHKLNATVAGSDQPHPILQNLIYSCREFMEAHIAGEIISEEIRENMYVA